MYIHLPTLLATSADRTFSERKGRGSAHFLYDKLHMKPLSSETLSPVISHWLSKTSHNMPQLLYDSILVMSPRILL